MNTNKDHDFFSWLKDSGRSYFGLYHAERYQEGRFPEKYPCRIRLVYTQRSEAVIQRWLSRFKDGFAVAVIKRDAGLEGIELAFTELNHVKLRELNKYDDILVFTIKSPLPNLNETGLLLMDMDSTAIKIECIDELAKMAGAGHAVADVTQRAMAGELDFEASLRLRVKQLAGAPEKIIQQLIEAIPLTDGLTSVCDELRQHNWKVALASGGFTPFADALKQKLNLTAAFANTLAISDGRLTGEVNGQIVDAQFKADAIKRLSETHDIAGNQAMAIGDGANDIPMLKQTRTGIAFYARSAVNAAADYKIDKLDLRALLFLTERR